MGDSEKVSAKDYEGKRRVIEAKAQQKRRAKLADKGFKSVQLYLQQPIVGKIDKLVASKSFNNRSDAVNAILAEFFSK